MPAGRVSAGEVRCVWFSEENQHGDTCSMRRRSDAACGEILSQPPPRVNAAPLANRVLVTSVDIASAKSLLTGRLTPRLSWRGQ